MNTQALSDDEEAGCSAVLPLPKTLSDSIPPPPLTLTLSPTKGPHPPSSSTTEKNDYSNKDTQVLVDVLTLLVDDECKNDAVRSACEQALGNTPTDNNGLSIKVLSPEKITPASSNVIPKSPQGRLRAFVPFDFTKSHQPSSPSTTASLVFKSPRESSTLTASSSSPRNYAAAVTGTSSPTVPPPPVVVALEDNAAHPPSSPAAVLSPKPSVMSKRTENSPITDVAVIYSGDYVPTGFEKIEKSPSGIRADLNKGGRGQFVYLCTKRDTCMKRPPIGEIIILLPDRGETLLPGYSYVKRRGVPANLNTGTLGEKVHLAVKRSITGWLTDVAVLFPPKGDVLPAGYMKIDTTPTGYSANVNTSTGGYEVYIAYKKRIELLEAVKNRWKRPVTVVRWRSSRGFWKEDDEAVSSPKSSSTSTTTMTAKDSSIGDGDKVTVDDAISSKSGNHHHRNSIASFSHKSEEEEFEAVVRDTTDESAFEKEATLQDNSENEEEEEDNTYGYFASMFSNFQVSPRSNYKASNALLEATITPQQCQFLYPILLGCTQRHGSIAAVSITGLNSALNSGVFDKDVGTSSITPECDTMFDIAVATVCEAANSGSLALFTNISTFLNLVIEKTTSGIRPQTLHRVLDTLIFMEGCNKRDTLSLLFRTLVSRLQEPPLPLCDTTTATAGTNINSTVSCIVTAVVDDVVDGVELAKATENVLSCWKGHASMHSVNFWRDLYWATTSSGSLVKSLVENNMYQVIATMCKVLLSTEKINALRLVDELLNVAATSSLAFKDSETFGQQIRRFLCPALNKLCASSLDRPVIFRQVLRVVSTLWNEYRKHLKIELALLFDNVLLRILRSTSNAAVTADRQLDIITELLSWFELPHNMIEMFLNFDMDRQNVQQWKIFESICGSLCAIVENSNTNSNPTTTTTSSSNNNNNTTDESTTTELSGLAMDALLSILRSLMDVSGHAHLISRDTKTRDLSMKQGWEQDNITEVGKISVRMRNELQKQSQEILSQGLDISRTKSLKKGIQYLIAMNVLRETPRDVASFLRMHQHNLGEAEIGDYLGEGDTEFKVHLRLTYVRAVTFTGKSLIASLRHFLTEGGFRLPGEAQKIERMVETFAQCFWEDNGSSCFSTCDTVMVLAYSCIMLNTDLHNPKVKKNKMSREQFVRNNRGIDDGKDVSKILLEEIYDDILANPIKIIVGNNSEDDEEESADDMVMMMSFHNNLLKASNQSVELMKDLSHSKRTFYFVGIDANISPDLVKVLFENVWFHILALSTSITGSNHSSLPMIMKCLDMLRYSISTCLFLGLRTEREAFVSHLATLRYINDEQQQESSSDYREEEWYKRMTDAADALDDPWSVLGDLHVLVNELKESVQVLQRMETLKSVMSRINYANSTNRRLFENTKVFLREGDLAKKCRSRNRTYRFFLFNDHLIYADKGGISGKWNVHNSLRLRLTRVADVPDSILAKHAFQILNPLKSFIVYADSSASKASWVRDIQDAIAEANKSHNVRRLSIRLSQLSLEEDANAASASLTTVEEENGEADTITCVTDKEKNSSSSTEKDVPDV